MFGSGISKLFFNTLYESVPISCLYNNKIPLSDSNIVNDTLWITDSGNQSFN